MLIVFYYFLCVFSFVTVVVDWSESVSVPGVVGRFFSFHTTTVKKGLPKEGPRLYRPQKVLIGGQEGVVS